MRGATKSEGVSFVVGGEEDDDDDDGEHMHRYYLLPHNALTDMRYVKTLETIIRAYLAMLKKFNIRSNLTKELDTTTTTTTAVVEQPLPTLVEEQIPPAVDRPAPPP